MATIEEEEDSQVWGVLWQVRWEDTQVRYFEIMQLSKDDLPRLDKQEGVPKLYRCCSGRSARFRGYAQEAGGAGGVTRWRPGDRLHLQTGDPSAGGQATQ